MLHIASLTPKLSYPGLAGVLWRQTDRQTMIQYNITTPPPGPKTLVAWENLMQQKKKKLFVQQFGMHSAVSLHFPSYLMKYNTVHYKLI